MTTSRYTENLSPERPHLAKGEVGDLRRDMYEAFASVETSNPKVSMIGAEDVTGGGTTQTVGFSLGALREEVRIQFAAFEDANLTVFPPSAAVLGSASKGTILSGEGSAALTVKTNADGEFECTLTNILDTTVYLACSPCFGGPAIDCTEVDSVEFSA